MHIGILRCNMCLGPSRSHQRPPNYASVLRWSLRKHLSLRPREETDFAISEASEFEHMALVYRTSVGIILADARAVVHVAASCFPVSRSSHIWSHPKRGHFRTLRFVSAVVRSRANILAH